MAKIILFGGGDGGGIIIHPKGITPIPPWDPSTADALEAAGRLARVEGTEDRFGLEGSISEDLGREVISRITDSVESNVLLTRGEHDVYYVGERGDFECGSFGCVPSPIPRQKLLEALEQTSE